MAVDYWDYWSNSTSTSTSGSTWSWPTQTRSTYWSTNTTTAGWVPVTTWVIERYVISDPVLAKWTDEDRANFTRVVNHETHTGFKIEMWIAGDVAITDPSVRIQDMAWLSMKLRQLATASDFAKISECLDQIAQGIAARSDETPPAAQPEGQEPDPEGDAP